MEKTKRIKRVRCCSSWPDGASRRYCLCILSDGHRLFNCATVRTVEDEAHRVCVDALGG
jgi:hypothetical protein